jgi:hypothetical protein
VLVGVFGPRREEVMETGENDIVRCFKNYILHITILGQSGGMYIVCVIDMRNMHKILFLKPITG